VGSGHFDPDGVSLPFFQRGGNGIAEAVLTVPYPRIEQVFTVLVGDYGGQQGLAVVDVHGDGAVRPPRIPNPAGNAFAIGRFQYTLRRRGPGRVVNQIQVHEKNGGGGQAQDQEEVSLSRRRPAGDTFDPTRRSPEGSPNHATEQVESSRQPPDRHGGQHQ